MLPLVITFKDYFTPFPSNHLLGVCTEHNQEIKIYPEPLYQLLKTNVNKLLTHNNLDAKKKTNKPCTTCLLLKPRKEKQLNKVVLNPLSIYIYKNVT